LFAALLQLYNKTSVQRLAHSVELGKRESEFRRQKPE